MQDIDRLIQWRFANPDKVRAANNRNSKRWRDANPEKQSAAVRRWQSANRDRVKAKADAWRAANPDKVKATMARHDAKPHRKSVQRGDRKAIMARYKEKNLEKIRARRRAYQAERRADPAQRLVDTVRRRMRHVIKGKSKGAFKPLCYTADDLRAHIEARFLDGMNWENYGLYGDKWHVDHIRPVSSFRLPDQLVECFLLENLQPLWAKDNLAKHAKMGGFHSVANAGP